MATIQIRRGLKADLPASGALGELFFCTDTNELFGYNGSSIAKIVADPGPISQSQVTGLVSDLAAKAATTYVDSEDAATLAQSKSYTDAGIATTEKTANKGVASGYASLDGSALVPAAQLPARTSSIQFVIGGGGTGITTGTKGQISIPFACTLKGWTLTADQPGSAVVDVLRSTYAGFPTTASIAGTDKPTLSSAQKNQNLGPLSAWGSTALAAGDELQVNVNSALTVTRLNLTLAITVP